MEGDAVSVTIADLVHSLHVAIIPWLPSGLREHAEQLKATLKDLQYYIDHVPEVPHPGVVARRFLKEVEAKAIDAENVLNEIYYQLHSNKMNKKRPSCLPRSNHRLLHQEHLALGLKEINKSFESVRRSAADLLRYSGRPKATSGTVPLTDDPILVGRDDDLSEIAEMLTTPTDEAISIISIVGMGGSGKTLLAWNVFNREETKAHFELYIWVHVSPNFDEVTILKKILSELGEQDVENESSEGLLEKLHEALETKMYLLVLDDVWNKKAEAWKDLITLLSKITSTKGNRIIVTTRDAEACPFERNLYVHHLNGLSEEECWSIIKHKTFKEGYIHPGSVEAIGRCIAGRCQGLPLAACVVGEALRGKSQDEWLSVKENWLSNENIISSTLRLSYDMLYSPIAKKCFAYCSVFQKGSQIERQDLIDLWMAEGFLRLPGVTDTQRDDGNHMFNLLVRVSLLQSVDSNEYGNVMRCSMHNLMHDIVATDEIHEYRYTCWKSHGNKSNPIPKEQPKLLRTLFYEGEILGMMFSEFNSLHALTLRDDDVEELPDSIKELIHLRYLNISRTCIKKVPDSIGELYQLQTFRARNRSLKKLPRTFKGLLNLRHLHLSDDAELPHQLGKLTSLQILPYFKVRDEESHNFAELGSLNDLRGVLTIDNLEKVRAEEDSGRANLYRKRGIVRLVLRWGESREGETNEESVLNGLEPHTDLKILEIVGFKGARYPPWTLRMEGFHHMKEIRLERCVECEGIPTLGHLKCLKSLYLCSLWSVKSISSSFYGALKETIDVFPALERLELKDMLNLREWVQVEVGVETNEKVFPRLKYLEISNCQQLMSFPSRFPCLEVVKIRGLWEILCLLHLLFHDSQNISVLEIKNCPKLREIPDGLQILTSLKELTILECENLKSIPYSSSTLLRRLSIGNETTFDFPCELIEAWVPSLQVLQLWGTPIQIQMIMDCIHKMPRLKALTMDGVSKFTITSPVEVGALPRLKTLTFCPGGLGSWDSASFNEAADGILRLGCSQIRTLELTGNVCWESLPDQLQHLTALSKLCLSNFGIEELPEWFESFSSLSELRLSLCKKLKGLPSVEVMQRLTNLIGLYIFRCPILKRRCIKPHDDEDSEWPKISHIRTVQADGLYIRGG